MIDNRIIDKQALKKILGEEDQQYNIVSGGRILNIKVTFGVIISDGKHPLVSNHGKNYSLVL